MMSKPRVQALLLLLRRTLELVPVEVYVKLRADRQWRFYYDVAMNEAEKGKLKPN